MWYGFEDILFPRSAISASADEASVPLQGRTELKAQTGAGHRRRTARLSPLGRRARFFHIYLHTSKKQIFYSAHNLYTALPQPHGRARAHCVRNVKAGHAREAADISA